MDKNPIKILAISPGTREFGVAILENEELVFYGVKSIRNQRTSRLLLQKVSRIIDRLIIEYKPTALAIKKPLVLQKSSALVVVVAEQIKSVARQSGLLIHEYDPQVIRRFVCQGKKATKKETAKIIATRCFELAQYSDRKKPEELLYWGRMFDAIAVGIVCYQQSSAT
jgi:Holliday junction resolvasome RuvABC endonuclease subunit